MELYTDEGAKEKTSPLWFSTAAIQLSNSIFEAAYNLSFYHQPGWTCSLFSLSAHLRFFKVTPASIFKVFKIVHQYSFWTSFLFYVNTARSDLDTADPARVICCMENCTFLQKRGVGGDSHLFSLHSGPSWLLVVCVILPDSLKHHSVWLPPGIAQRAVQPVCLWRIGAGPRTCCCQSDLMYLGKQTTTYAEITFEVLKTYRYTHRNICAH